MKDIKEPDFVEFEAPDTDLENLEFNIESDTETPEFKINNFETPETVPEFNLDENISENKPSSLETLEKNLANEFIETTGNNIDFKIPENNTELKASQNEENFKIATTELETKIENYSKTQKTTFLKKFNLKNMFKDK